MQNFLNRSRQEWIDILKSDIYYGFKLKNIRNAGHITRVINLAIKESIERRRFQLPVIGTYGYSIRSWII